MKEKISGIYRITNLINNMLYIGQSVDIKQRFTSHKAELRGQYHNNDKLQKSWNKYGEENFRFEIIEKCNIDILDEREKYWIGFYKSNTRSKGFNLDGGGNNKKQLSKETRLRISKNHVDVSGINNPFYGKKHTEEIMNKIINSDGYKNRKVYGEDSHKAELTLQQVIEIKKRLENNESYITLAKEYNVGVSAIQHIKHNRSWKWVVV